MPSILLRGAVIADTTADARFVRLESQALLARDGAITWHGDQRSLPKGLAIDEEIDLGGRLVTPGLIDCHTHLVYAKKRVGDFVRRLGGSAYAELSGSGEGIGYTVSATRDAEEDQLYTEALSRLRRMAAAGATTVEIKSGYGLDTAGETKILRVARRLGREGIADIRTTFLGAHSMPPGFAGTKSQYLKSMAADTLPRLVSEGLVDNVDAFCETIAFSPAELEPYFGAATGLGLRVKAHLDQLSETGGARMLARFGAISADHLEYSGPDSIAELANCGAVAVLLPGAFYFLRESRAPDVATLRTMGVPMAVATDHNPGTSPMESLPLAMNMACVLFGLTPAEALRGVTENAARALGLDDRGRIASGLRADLAIWDVEDPAELCYNVGFSPLHATVLRGELSRENSGH